MIPKRFFFLALALALGVVALARPSTAAAQLSIAAPTSHEVHLLTAHGTHDGTASRVWVRIYSADRGAWSSWQSVDGLVVGSATGVLFETAPSFTNVTRVQVWEGQDDGARVSVRVRSSNGTTSQGTQSRVWVKNSSAFFDLVEVQAFECDYQPMVCACDVSSGDCFALWLLGICSQDSWECYDYTQGGKFCTCLP